VTLVAGAVVGGVEFMKEIAGRVREGVLLEGQLAVEVDESGFGANEVLEADFAEGDFRDCCFFERGLGEKVVVVASDAFGDLLRGFRVIVKGGVVGRSRVLGRSAMLSIYPPGWWGRCCAGRCEDWHRVVFV